MHASSFADFRHHWHDRVEYALHPHLPDAEHFESHRLADNPMRERIRYVRFVPLIVPGLAVLLACCAVVIGSLLR